MVVATSPDGVIGKVGLIPWHLPRDLKRFRSITMGHPILMGRRTHESIGRPLPGRVNVVVSTRHGYQPEGCTVARSPEEALRIAADSGAEEAMVVGGERLYRHFLPTCDAVHLTVVEGQFDGDARFPIEQLLASAWTVEQREEWPADDRNPFPHRYELLRRPPGH
ncbi:Dihydrofolate reductase type 3 [Tautonia plasticadhaerens]|uniref:Dihydrofolate reductase n=2 Tax=Tautonia plasticadhaerens TaxID=2527974 RepID=A0A518HC79_9BACT|nr:Dihydrofolate reductase type 3 [Tautonia plasticadhaerens]